MKAIHHHLINDIGFYEVGFAPVTSNENAAYNLSGDQLLEVFEQMKVLGREYQRAERQRRVVFGWR